MEYENKELTVQELCDRLTVLCHKGHAQAVVKHPSNGILRSVTNVEMIGDTIALITSGGCCGNCI